MVKYIREQKVNSHAIKAVQNNEIDKSPDKIPVAVIAQASPMEFIQWWRGTDRPTEEHIAHIIRHATYSPNEFSSYDEGEPLFWWHKDPDFDTTGHWKWGISRVIDFHI